MVMWCEDFLGGLRFSLTTVWRFGCVGSISAWNTLRRCRSSGDLSGLGWMEILTASVASRRRISSVAKRVQRLSLVGNVKSEMASRTEPFPADWLPQTTICRRSTYRLTPFDLSLSIMSRWSRWFSDCNCYMAAVFVCWCRTWIRQSRLAVCTL
jgi:hypothetical protein